MPNARGVVVSQCVDQILQTWFDGDSFLWKDEWTPEWVTRFSWVVNIRSMQDKEFDKRWVVSFITCVRP